MELGISPDAIGLSQAILITAEKRCGALHQK
jgi:hypothetical protein